MANKFSALRLANWRQFREVDIEFHPRLTVLTGANGAGKTTILNVLSRHFGWSVQLISTRRLDRKGAWSYYSGIGADDSLDEQDESVAPSRSDVGVVVYSDGESAQLRVPGAVQAQYEINVHNQRPVPGIFLPSHRPVYSYRNVDQIPTKLDANDELFEGYLQNLRQFYAASGRIESPSYRLKAALISLATFGYGNAVVRENPHAIRTFEGFQIVLKKVLPRQLGFERISIRMPDVFLECRSGDFSLDAASGGVSAIIDMSWQIYMKSILEDSFVVIADEPENHLHPELQRSLLPGLIDAFPQAQFIIATHNPFIVTSVPESSVYVLDFATAGVESSRLPYPDRTGSANQVLADVLGVPFPMPLWVEREVDRIVAEFQAKPGPPTEERFSEVRTAMIGVGLGHLFPEVVDRLLRQV